MQRRLAIVKASIKCFNAVCSIHGDSLITEEGVELQSRKARSNEGGVKLSFFFKLSCEQNVGVNLQHNSFFYFFYVCMPISWNDFIIMNIMHALKLLSPSHQQ